MRRLVGVDRLSSLFLIVFALALLWFGRDLPAGTLTVMGPGYIPFVLAGCLIFLGVVIGIRSIGSPGDPLEAIPLRPLLAMAVAILSFALLLERAGLIPAATSAVFFSAFAAPGVRVGQSLLLAVGLAMFSAVLFVWLLGVPVRVWSMP